MSACVDFCRKSAWKCLSDEVRLPAQGLDLVIHLGDEVKIMPAYGHTPNGVSYCSRLLLGVDM